MEMQIQPLQANHSVMRRFFRPALIAAAVIFFLTGPGMAADRFVDNGDGTITDNETGLMWSRAASTLKKDLSRAWSYAEKSNLGGHTDWRLPTKSELESLGNPFPFSVFDLKRGEYLTLSTYQQKSGDVYVAQMNPMKKEITFAEGPDRFPYYILIVRDK